MSSITSHVLSTAYPQSNSRLLSLPAELKLLILFFRFKHLTKVRPKNYQIIKKMFLDPVLTVCKGLAPFALTIFYTKLEFLVAPYRKVGHINTQLTSFPSGRGSETQLAIRPLIRHITINLDSDQSELNFSYLDELSKVGFKHLKHLHIVWLHVLVQDSEFRMVWLGALLRERGVLVKAEQLVVMTRVGGLVDNWIRKGLLGEEGEDDEMEGFRVFETRCEGHRTKLEWEEEREEER